MNRDLAKAISPMKEKYIPKNVNIFIGVLLITFLVVSSLILKKISSQESALNELQKQNNELSSHFTQVALNYNEATGRLYPFLPDNIVQPHTCVWTILGDHGSYTSVVTNDTFISNETNSEVKLNKFLPPRVPIYMTCINWNNHIYQGVTGN